MKKTITLITLLGALCYVNPILAGDLWYRVAARPSTDVHLRHVPANSLTYKADMSGLKSLLSASGKGAGIYIELPMPDGSLRSFRVYNTPVLPPELAAKYSGLQTYSAVAIDNPAVTAKLDYTTYGFHAMVYDGYNTSLIDPAGAVDEGVYVVHYKRDEIKTADGNSGCQTISPPVPANAGALMQRPTKTTLDVVHTCEARKYRLALSCTHQYAQKVTNNPAPSKADVLSKMTTTINRVNGVYERELSVSMEFVADEDKLIFPNAAGDLIGNFNESASGLMDTNQKLTDRLIGDANYDIGHAFSTGAGGLSQVGVVCKQWLKAQSVTGRDTPYGDGFDIDYVVHEIGHEFGADHTFNNNQSGACYANAVPGSAYEPGSGSTIMAYAGICTSDNIQRHSDAYFHAASLKQIYNYIKGPGDACAVKTVNGNKPPDIDVSAVSFVIPANTPFELTAPQAVDVAGGSAITYCWEQWDLGEFGKKQVNTTMLGPLFRSYEPVTSPTRVFPNLEMLRNGVLSNASVDNASGEKIPDVTRMLTFRVTVRSLKNNYGCFTIPGDTIHIDVANTGQPFKVTSQATTGISYQGYSKQQLTWNVAGTNSTPVNAPDVDIYLSPDGGKTWPYNLGKFANNGTATVTIPNPDTNITAARFKVKGTDKIFFGINAKDFSIIRNFESSITLSPVPAGNTLHVASDNTGAIDAAVYDMLGRVQWQGEIIGSADLPVYLWARGVYIMKLVDNGNRRSIKKFVVQ